MRPARVLALALAAALGLTAARAAGREKVVCDNQAANNDLAVQGGRVVRDDAGAEFRVTETPRRIVSLAPNITEILFALGLGGRLVGVTRYCDYPPSALAIEKVGGLLDPDVERIRSLRPDLVVAFRGNPWDAVERLKSLRLRVFVLDIGRTLDDVPRTIAALGRITLREAEAAALNASLEGKSRALARSAAASPRKPRVFVMLQGLGLSTCGGASYLNDLLERAGGTNVAAGIKRDWLEYGRERLIRDDPDLILVLAPTEADFARSRAWLEAQTGLRDLRAVRSGRILRLDENAASRFGPRLYDTLAEIARLLREAEAPPPRDCFPERGDTEPHSSYTDSWLCSVSPLSAHNDL